MKKIKQYLLILTVLFACTNCSESFFDLLPSNAVNVDNVYKTANDFNQSVIGCYAKLQTQVSYYTEFCEFRSDNLFLRAPTTSTQDRYDIDQFVETSANGLLNSYWENLYNTIYRCNSVLDHIGQADFDKTLVNQYKGEALFIRALTYFNMYRLWGTVPLTSKAVSPKEALTIGRSSEEQMYKFLFNDLDEASGILPRSYSSDDIGRATSGAALSLLAKVNLTFNKWNAAKTALEQVIGKYGLTSEPGSVFDVNNKQNTEIIFSVRFNKNIEGEGHSAWNTTTNPEDENSQSPVLKNCYTSDDKRKELISWVKVSGSLNYSLKKYYDTESPTTLTTGNDQILLRYADVLLMYAEALNEIAYDNSSDSPALKHLNEVHTRAGLTAISISEVPDQNSFRNAILIERQKEFPYEGHRWFDLVRMGAAKEAMQAVGLTIEDYQYVFPIPQTEIERINNKSLLWQNTGYN